MIRLILVIIFLLLYFILGLPVLGVLWLIGKRNKPAADIASLRIVQWAFKVILFLCGTKLTVIGEENVPKDQPVLYIANHQSYFDIVVSYSRCPGLTGYIAKDGLEKFRSFHLDETALLSVFEPSGYQRGNEDDLKGN